MPRFLHAVCGNSDKFRTTRIFETSDWEEVRMDMNPEVKPDVLSTLLDMTQFPDEYFDAVFTAHSLERLYPHEVGRALGNIFRVLNADGYLIVSCADLQAACTLVAQDKLLEPAYESPAGPVAPMDIIYGFRPALAAGFERHACKSGFTARALMGTLAQAGFGAMWAARNPEAFTVVALASKQEHSEEYLKELAVSHFG